MRVLKTLDSAQTAFYTDELPYFGARSPLKLAMGP
jgi:hypothetical protein